MPLLSRIGKTTAHPAPEAQKPSEQEPPAYLDCLAQSKREVLEKISGLYLELGKAYYERHADDHQTEHEEHLTAIRNAYAEIDQYQQQADEIAMRQRCPVCGAKLPEGSMFCNICGTKLPDAPIVTADQEPRLCPRCKTALSPDDMFCTSCGADLRKERDL